MRLQVGELAKRSGLTVRTLHHYDAIGLLKPSARSAAGYRLYDEDDIARLHAIQALRHLGLRLEQIGELLAGGGAALPLVIGRQIEALEREIAQAGELRARLLLLQRRLAGGARPETGEWLATLALMETYGKYFSAAELKAIFRNWKDTEAEWPPLIAAARAAMRRRLAPESPEAQELARRWIDLASRAMGGDPALLRRWQRMLMDEPAIGRRRIDPEVRDYLRRAAAQARKKA